MIQIVPPKCLRTLNALSVFQRPAHQLRVDNRFSIIGHSHAPRFLQIAHFGYVMENGKIVLESQAEELRENPDVKEFYLGTAASGALKTYKDVKSYKRRKRWL